MLLTPTLAHGIVFGMRVLDRGAVVFDEKVFRAFPAVILFGVLLMIVCSFLFVDWILGLVFICVVAFVIYALA